ncbi:hypothetical protein B0H13DRAFT_1859301 [Mycena leptocephala]|nr:hypothetical protein B0H13DRAFT_1859301 [Mycena leptocephala]
MERLALSAVETDGRLASQLEAAHQRLTAMCRDASAKSKSRMAVNAATVDQLSPENSQDRLPQIAKAVESEANAIGTTKDFDNVVQILFVQNNESGESIRFPFDRGATFLHWKSDIWSQKLVVVQYSREHDVKRKWGTLTAFLGHGDRPCIRGRTCAETSRQTLSPWRLHSLVSLYGRVTAVILILIMETFDPGRFRVNQIGTNLLSNRRVRLTSTEVDTPCLREGSTDLCPPVPRCASACRQTLCLRDPGTQWLMDKGLKVVTYSASAAGPLEPPAPELSSISFAWSSASRTTISSPSLRSSLVELRDKTDHAPAIYGANAIETRRHAEQAIILLVGHSGHGKSKTINRLMGRDLLPIGRTTAWVPRQSYRKVIQRVKLPSHNSDTGLTITVAFDDTPGPALAANVMLRNTITG